MVNKKIERRDIQENIYKGSGTAPDGPPDTLVELVEWLNSKLNQAPEQYKSEVICDVTSDYDSGTSIEWEIYYMRPETDDEFQSRIGYHERQAILEEARERQQLERLKRKYEGAAD